MFQKGGLSSPRGLPGAVISAMQEAELQLSKMRPVTEEFVLRTFPQSETMLGICNRTPRMVKARIENNGNTKLCTHMLSED